MDEVRIGIIGCGGNARGHMSRLGNINAARLVAVCDLDGERAQQAAETTGAEAYTDLSKMLERDDLDAAYLSIPVFAHGEPELAVIDRGLPFLVEKPVARHLEEALEIEEAVSGSGLMTCVGYQLRYFASTDIARETLAGETISLVSGMYWCGSGRVAGSRKSWVVQMDKSGGQILEQATHTIDMMRYLVGEVAEVSARHATRQIHDIDCPDAHCITFEFESGALGVLTTTWAFDPLDWTNTNVVDVLYGQCRLRWDRDTLYIHKRRQKDVQGEVKEEMGVEELSAPSPNIDEVFVEAVRTDDSSIIRSSYSDAVKTLAVCLAAIEAGQTRKPVRM